MAKLPPELLKHADKVDDNWKYGEFDPEDGEQHNKTSVNNFVLYSIWFYKESNYQDRVLWEYFQQDFKDWTKEL